MKFLLTIFFVLIAANCIAQRNSNSYFKISIFENNGLEYSHHIVTTDSIHISIGVFGDQRDNKDKLNRSLSKTESASIKEHIKAIPFARLKRFYHKPGTPVHHTFEIAVGRKTYNLELKGVRVTSITRLAEAINKGLPDRYKIGDIGLRKY